MPDTGAPYFIPFADSSDLVRDWPDLSEDVAEAVADAIPRGLGLNVVQSVLTDIFTTTTTSFTTVTGLSASITPSSTSSKVLIIAQVTWAFSGGTFVDERGHFKVTRGGTDIYIGDTAGNRVRAVYGGSNRSDNVGAINSNSIVFLDSPNTISSTTYRVEARTGSGTALYVNRSSADTDDANHTRGASSITVIEVAA
jgi:hypothetical protein